MNLRPLPVLIALAPAPLLAHGMRLEVRVDAQGQVVGTAAYGRHAVAHAEVQLLAADGRVVVQGRTDAQGAFRLTVPQAGDYRLVVSDGAHRGEKPVVARAFPAALAAPVPQGEDTRLAAVVEAAVARRLEPLELQLQRQADALRLRDLLGGIGYILGLAGIAFYVAGRKR